MRVLLRLPIDSSAFLLLAIFLPLLPAALFAEGETGFYEGRITLELRGSPLSSVHGGLRDAVERDNASRLPLLTLLSSTPDRQLLGLALAANAPHAKLDAVGGEFLFEYGVADWLGLGFTVHHSRYTVRDFTNSALIQNYFLPITVLTAGSSSGLPFSEGSVRELFALALHLDTVAARITTLDFNITFHFLDRSAFDPYLRIIIGGGVGGGFVGRAGGAAGARFYFAQDFFLSLEANHSYYGRSDDGYDDDTSIAVEFTTFTETAGYAGLGVSF
jgi:hypothetical protein